MSGLKKQNDIGMNKKPLSDFVDDRVELIRQAFSCLKPKTIKNICPEFLKGKSIEKLQEMCLDEVLGVSTTRLLSVINATICPSDTDSSDSNASNIKDHITLSEISSDENFLEENNKRRKRQKKKNTVAESHNSKYDSSKVERSALDEKEMTVLELLELQARARAIRSQLAMEPVTKIELNSDSEEEKQRDGSNSRNSERITLREPTVKLKKNANESEKLQSKVNDVVKSDKKPCKKIKLVREFSNVYSDQERMTDRENKTKSPNTSHETIEKPLPNPEIKKYMKNESKTSRETSPDVIAMHPSPETVTLSSDSEIDAEEHTVVKVTHIPSPQKDTILRDSPIELTLSTEENDYDVLEISHSSKNNSEEEVPEKETQAEISSHVTIDSITLSENLREETRAKEGDAVQSWEQRWLLSQKVTKVMASSRLASKIRSKIKDNKTRKAAQITAEEKFKETEEKVESVNIPAEKMGSIIHFRMLKKEELNAKKH